MSAPEDDDGTLGCCGCVDYHYADCPLRTGARDDYEPDPDDQYDGWWSG